jgi:hypothetical protein
MLSSVTAGAPSCVWLLVNVGFDGPLQAFVRRWDATIGRTVRIATYQSLLVQSEAPAGTYIFTDLDRIPASDVPGVLGLWDALRASGGAHLVNDPRRVRLRYSLLRQLFEDGVNDFNVYRADELDNELRYPVFVRCEHDHGGPRTPLLYDRPSLERALARLRARRSWRTQLLITECAAEPHADGLYRKYGAVLVNDDVIPWHVIASRSWLVKSASRETNDRLREEQRQYIAANPHRDAIRQAFAAARIDYGRIDYAVRGDRLRVFEINTNPALGGSGRRRRATTGRRTASDPALLRLAEAFAALAARCPAPGRTIPLVRQRGMMSGWAYQGLRRGQSLITRYAHRSGIR